MSAKILTFQIVSKNGKPCCNICQKEFKSSRLSKHNIKRHLQSTRHKKALNRFQSEPKIQPIQHKTRSSTQPSQTPNIPKSRELTIANISSLSSECNEDLDSKQFVIESDTEFESLPTTPRVPKNAEVPSFEIVTKNTQWCCNICQREFKSSHPSTHDVELHQTSARHKKALYRLQSEPKYEPIQTQENNSTQPSNPLTVTKSRPMNTVIVFEFDDTLFPTTKLKEILNRPNKVKSTKNTTTYCLADLLTMQESQELINLSQITHTLLSLYIAQYSKDNICIVTSSNFGWVKHWLSLVYNIGYYPQIYHLLFDENPKDTHDKISIYHPTPAEFVSIVIQMAELEHFENMSLHPMSLWKHKTFGNLFCEKAKLSDDLINTFVFIGNSLIEHEAAQKLKECVESVYGNNNKRIFIDRVKLIKVSTFDILIKEQRELIQLCENKCYQNCSIASQNGFDLQYKSGKFVLHQL